MGVAGLLSALVWNAHQASSARANAVYWENHTQSVLLAAQSCLSALQDTETGQRGYIITAHANFLEPFASGTRAIGPCLDVLGRLTSDNAAQHRRLVALRAAVAAKLADETSTIALVNTGHTAAAIAEIDNGHGKALMDNARAITAGIVGTELQRLAPRRQAVEKTAATNVVFFVLVAGVGLLAMLVAMLTGLVAMRAADRARLASTRMASEARLGLFIDHAPAAIAMFDTNMRYIMVSRRFISDYGLDLAEGSAALVGRSHYEVFPEISAEWRALHRRVMRGETISSGEEAFARSNSSIDWVHWEMVPWHEADGAIGGAMLFSESLTERREAQAALRESDRQLRLIFDTVPVGIIIAEAPSGRITGGNQMVERIFRHPVIYSAESTLYREWVSFHADGRRVESHEYPLARALSGEDFAELEVQYQRGDGSRLWVRLIGTPIRSDGVITGAMVVVLDIDRKIRALEELSHIRNGLELRVKAEVELREKAQSELLQGEKLAALGQLAGGVAHDFNNVLQVVSGSAALIQRHAGDTALVKRLSGMVEDAAARGASITRRLLALARRDELNAEPIDLAPLLHSLRELMQSMLGSMFTVEVSLAADLPPVLADRRQLETVLINLLTNARDAMPLGGLITVFSEAQTVLDGSHPSLAPGHYVRFAITDAGVGMDPAILARIFEPFFTTKPQGKGTGLGLPMARGFAEQSGGALTVASHAGKGSTVTFWLPIARGSADAAAADADAKTPPRFGTETARAPRSRILLVDDDELVLEVLAARLADFGYDIVQADRGEMALGLLDAGERVDVLVSDLTMPGMNGVHLINQAHARRPNLPAILLTGYAGDAAELAVGEAIRGQFSLMRKPTSSTELADRIESLLASNRLPTAPR